MAIAGDVGNGATFTLGTQAISLLIKSIQIGAITVDMLDVSLLATTDFMLEIAAELKKAPEITVNFLHATLLDEVEVGVAAETGTVTFPLRTGEGTAANLAGTGQVTSFKLPDLQINTVQEGSLVFKYNGDTGPTYTKAVAA